VRPIPTETFHNLKVDKKFRIVEASINAFSELPFDQVQVSTIIKEAKIPRGSFYQYFEDKFDLYQYIFSKVAERKMQYMADLLPNQQDTSFFDLFSELFERGAKFAVENPRYIAITKYLFSSRGELYDTLLKDNLSIAKEYYINYIENDKEKGRIRPEIDSEVLAEMVIELSMNVTVEQLLNKDGQLDFDYMKDKIQKILTIFKKGIITGE
jgi:AcrR family transcriptional regulator